ncbi:MAG: InlB B-repeat-containing protein [Evtepia gabavorous]
MGFYKRIRQSCTENLKPISIGNQQYIKFETEAFSPFALVYEKDTGGSGPSRPTYYTLTYDSNGGTQYDSERYRRNTVVQLDKVPTREGYTFTGWYADKELTQAITEIKMTSNKTVYAGWEETDVPGMLNGEDHYAYVVGYEDGLTCSAARREDQPGRSGHYLLPAAPGPGAPGEPDHWQRLCRRWRR